MALRHFLTLSDLSSHELQQVIKRAIKLKSEHKQGNIYEPLKNRVLALIFEKSSTRTRVSFESGMAQFGGSSLFLSPRDTQLGRGEPIEDSAKVLSRMVDAIAIRTFEHKKLALFAEHSSVPVINALTDDFHPCQLLADMQTYQEHRGSIEGKKVVWIGDGNNMCNSFINAAKLLNFEFVISSPLGYDPSKTLLKTNNNNAHIIRNPTAAVKNADLIVTDVWASMGQEDEQNKRINDFKNYQVNPELMSHANSDALFMHCLPAHRGEEISEDMLEHPSSVVWDEAENRLHSQKSLLEFLLCNA
ncbi:MAG: ornithine carbamoyltransferase [Pseudohongiellaceae bacterium]|jgi:ornithine carbamoyltransferase